MDPVTIAVLAASFLPMIFGGGGGGGGDQASATQARLSEEYFEMLRPLLELLSSQGVEALQTGGVGARIPIIQRAVEGTRVAASQAETRTTESLAQAGLMGTPFGENILAGQRTQAGLGEQSQLNQILMQFISQLPSFGTTGAGQAIGGLGQAGAAAATGKAAETTGFYNLLSALTGKL